MRRVVLFIAMSLDGYIADQDGGVEWLAGQDKEAETADSYGDFEKGIDTVIMGWRTYRQITEELSPDHWVYENLQCYVLTHRDCPSAAKVTFLAEDPCALVRSLQEREGRDIWICGGADIVRQLMEQDLIDIYHISVIPTILGGGIRLFADFPRQRRLYLETIRSSNGIVEMIYRRNGA